jgi:hypothetical protein
MATMRKTARPMNMIEAMTARYSDAREAVIPSTVGGSLPFETHCQERGPMSLLYRRTLFWCNFPAKRSGNFQHQQCQAKLRR